jgi:hypothetical protein
MPGQNANLSLLTQEDDGEEDELSVDPKRRNTMDLHMKEREGKLNANCLSWSPLPSSRDEPFSLPLGQARPIGASQPSGGNCGRWGKARLAGA